jgi:hypothetical protein
MGAVTLLVLTALGAGSVNDPAAMACGFPSVRQGEPAIQVEIAQSHDIFLYPGYVSVQISLSTGAQLSARAQSIGTPGQSAMMIAGSPIDQVYYTIALSSDGSAALSIRDLRFGDGQAREVTRHGSCSDHQRLLDLVQT